MMRPFMFIAACLLLASPASAVDLDSLSNRDAVGGLKEALSKGADAAVSLLGRENGFLGNDKVRIPLPPALDTVAGAMRTFGMGKQADDLVAAMNHAAETAMAEARPLLADAIRRMTVEDAKGILTGGDDAATAYFRRTTEQPLGVKFLPVVKRATDRVGLAQTYNRFAGQATQFGLGNAGDTRIENYVTRKALDGLYTMIAEQERAIRRNPLEQGGKLIGKVFGAIR